MTSPVYFTVEADFKAFIEDVSSDSDYDPQVVPISATVTFTPLINAGDVVLATNASPRPTGFIPAPITAIIDSADGRLKMRTGTDAGATGFSFAPVRLLGSSALLELDGPLEYSVRFSEVVFSNGRRGTIASFNFEAPNSDTVLNLIEVARVPGQPQSGITKIAPGGVRLEDGDVIFSFAGLDIPESIPFSPIFTSDEITDLTATGQAVITAANAAAARTAIGAENAAMKGASGGYTPLDATGKVDAVYLPSYVDDVLSYANEAAFPVTGETGKIYVALDNNDAFRWTGSAYLRISDRVTAAGITDSTTVGRALVTAASAPAARAAVDIDAVYVESFRDGVRTDHEILTAAFAAATAGSEVVFGPGVTYTLSETFAPVLTDKPGLTINGQGATLTGSATILFQPKGTVFSFGSRPTLTAAISAPTKTLTVDSTSALQVGDLVAIYSDTELFDGVTNTGGETKQEMARVRSVTNATTVVLEGKTWDTYSITGKTVKLAHYRPMQDITVRDLTLVGDRTAGRVGMQAAYFDGLTFINVRTTGFALYGFDAFGGFNANFIGCHATECSIETLAGYGDSVNGYGMHVGSVHGAKFIGCYGTRNRHTFDLHGSRDVLMLGCTVEYDRSSAFSTHGLDTVKIINCTARQSGGGIIVRGTNNIIRGNSIVGCIGTTESGNQSYVEGIWVGIYGGQTGAGGRCGDNLIIENNYIDISGYDGVVADTSGSGIRIDSTTNNAVVRGNIIKGFGRYGVSVRGNGNNGLDISNNLMDVSGQQNLTDGSTNRSAIFINPLSTDPASVINRDIRVMNNTVTAGVPQHIVYMYGGYNATYVSSRIKVIGNRAETCSAAAVNLDDYFGSNVEVYGNITDPAVTPVTHNAARFASPLITNPVSPSAPLATTTAIAAGSIEVGHASDTTVTRSAAGKLAVEGVDIPTVSSTDTLTSKTLTSPKVNEILDTNGNRSVVVQTTTSAVNYAAIKNAAAGGDPIIGVTGSDTHVGLRFQVRGVNDPLSFEDGSNNEIAQFYSAGVSSVNNTQFYSAVTGSGPRIVAAGDDTNVDLRLESKGTGTVQANGVPVVTTARTVNSKALSSDVTLTQDDVSSGTTNKVFTVTEQTKLAGIATGATANASDATLLARANHTGTQLASTISDFSTAADTRIAAGTTAATSKTTPVDADELPLVDSAASNALKKLTWSNLKATLKTYFDSVSTTLSAKSIALGSNTVTGTIAEFNTALTDADFATLGGTETLTAKTLTSPRINQIGDSNGNVCVLIQTTASSVNYLALKNAAVDTDPIIGTTGSNSHIGIRFQTRGVNKPISLEDGSNNEIAQFYSGGTSSVNNVAIYSALTTAGPRIVATGSDTNVDLRLESKGTGTVQANGVAVSTNSTSATHTAQQIELGHASDTTVSRASAGQIAVEGNPVGIKVAVPASAGATGVVGQWAADASWFYVCTATNTWVRAALATW